jgi:hypothetical protein
MRSDTFDIDEIIGSVNRLAHATSAEDQFDSLAFILEYLREEFLPPPALPILQSFLLRGDRLPDALADLSFSIVSYVGEFLDPQSDFTALLNLMIAAYPLPSAASGLHALLRSQLSVARAFLPHFEEFCTAHSLEPPDIAALLLCLARHETLVPDALAFLPSVAAWLRDETVVLQSLAILRALTRNALGLAAVFELARSVPLFHFEAPLVRATLKLILLLAFHEPRRTLRLLAERELLDALAAAVSRGVADLDANAIELCRALADTAEGVDFLASSGLLAAVAGIGNDAGFERWAQALRVVCAAVCHGTDAVLAAFVTDQLFESLAIVLSPGGSDEQELFLATAHAVATAMERDGRADGVAEAFASSGLLDALAALQARSPIARLLCERFG